METIVIKINWSEHGTGNSAIIGNLQKIRVSIEIIYINVDYDQINDLFLNSECYECLELCSRHFDVTSLKQDRKSKGHA